MIVSIYSFDFDGDIGMSGELLFVFVPFHRDDSSVAVFLHVYSSLTT